MAISKADKGLETAFTSQRPQADASNGGSGSVEAVRFLAADTSLHAQLRNARLVMGQAEHVDEVLRIDRDWETEAGFTLGWVCSILADEDGHLRMYYELMKSNEERCCAVAFSDDGLHWDKLELGLAPGKYIGHDSNIINVQDTQWFRGTCVFLDEAAPAQERYKMTWRLGDKMESAVSADGLNFRNIGVPAMNSLDSLNVSFLDPLTGRYTVYARWWIDKVGANAVERLKNRVRRGVSIVSSERWDGHWPGGESRQLVIDPKDIPGEDGWTDIYSPGVQPYHGQYVGLPAMYFRTPFPDYSSSSGPIYPVFMHSRDGVDWTFPAPRHPIIDLAAHGQDTTNFGTAYPAASMLQRDGQLWIYHTYQSRQHHEPSSGHEAIHLARLRLDGFGAVTSPSGEEGAWTSPVLHLAENARELHVNLDAKGHVRTEVLQADADRPLAGFTARDCLPLQGDHLDAVAAWQDAGLKDLAAGRIRLRLYLRDAYIYSFWFTV